MEAWLHMWLSLLLRWAHFIVGVAWIGASFYFNWLENQLQRRVDAADKNDPIAGDLWAVHGGGFYYLQKFRIAPDHLPEPLHWFKYEAYFTWITGIALLAVVYYWNASLFMLDPSVSDISPGMSIVLGVASLLLSWLVYDGLCRSPLRVKPMVLGLMTSAWFLLVAVVLSHYLSGRAAFIHVGAAIGTVMVANVFFVIIPAQKELVAALLDGRPPDASKAQSALLRSRHNNYFTLPVLFIMISNHYPASYGHAHNWVFLAVFSSAAVGVRHWFNVRHLPQHSRWVLPAAIMVMLGLMFSTMPVPKQDVEVASKGQSVLATTEVMPLITERCSGCHSSKPSFSGFTIAPLNIIFDTPAEVETQALMIYQAAVVNRTMPLANLSGITEAEREMLGRWYQGQIQQPKSSEP